MNATEETPKVLAAPTHLTDAEEDAPPPPPPELPVVAEKDPPLPQKEAPSETYANFSSRFLHGQVPDTVKDLPFDRAADLGELLGKLRGHMDKRIEIFKSLAEVEAQINGTGEELERAGVRFTWKLQPAPELSARVVAAPPPAPRGDTAAAPDATEEKRVPHAHYPIIQALMFMGIRIWLSRTPGDEFDMPSIVELINDEDVTEHSPLLDFHINRLTKGQVNAAENAFDLARSHFHTDLATKGTKTAYGTYKFTKGLSSEKETGKPFLAERLRIAEDRAAK